jgi:hypothetical protein
VVQTRVINHSALHIIHTVCTMHINCDTAATGCCSCPLLGFSTAPHLVAIWYDVRGDPSALYRADSAFRARQDDLSCWLGSLWPPPRAVPSLIDTSTRGSQDVAPSAANPRPKPPKVPKATREPCCLRALSETPMLVRVLEAPTADSRSQ